MGRRGRPPFPDILTPREWEVLALLRENLTNEAIAVRLGVTHAAAKYHVSEILSKLGVASREEAAAWEPRLAAEAGKPRLRWWGLGMLGWLRPVTVGKAALIGASVVVVAGMGVLAWGVLRDAGEDCVAAQRTVTDATPTPSPYLSTEEAAIGLVMEQLANGGSRPSAELFDISVEQMLYGEAAIRAQPLGFGLQIQPEDYSCPPLSPCPYPGEPADQRGWLIIVSGLDGYAPEPGLTRFVAWVGGGGITSGFVP